MQAKKITVIGAGSFGSVLANILAENGHNVHVYLRSLEHCEQLKSTRKNQRYLDNFIFEPGIVFDNKLDIALENADLIFIAVPSKAFRAILPEIKRFIPENCGIVSTAKGVEPQSFKLMTQVIQEELPAHRVAALSGPNLAAEIARKELTGSVVASVSPEFNKEIQSVLASKYFRVYDNEDIFGVELAGALKNIYAIAAGMAHALGMGENARSMLLTRSLAEMSRFAVSLGANPMTFLGLAGVGDLFVTCSSPLSRNFRLGTLVAQGKLAEVAIKEIGSTVEGYLTVKSVCEEAAKRNIYMPLATALYQVLYEQANIADLVKSLMLGESNHDVEFSGASS